MKKFILEMLFIGVCLPCFTQVDTISENIYQKNGRLGIGIDDPTIRFHLYDFNTQILLGYQPAYQGPYINIYGSTEHIAPMLGLGVANEVYYNFDDTLAMKDWSYIYGNNLNLGIAILPDLQYAIYGIYLNREGKTGINTKKPTSALEISKGDVYISDIEKGIIMKSPDGQCWKGLLDNSGKLNFEQIECPEVQTSQFNQQKIDESFSVYPNPSEGTFTIDLKEKSSIKLEYLIYNIHGQLVAHGKIKPNVQRVNITNLLSGNYLIAIHDINGNRIASEKIIIK